MKNYYRQTEFLYSAPNLSKCPSDFGVEVAFAGRSNAGKSSALNTLTDNKKLSKISKIPGRTQLLNFFTVAEHRRLVDLPGYGYAKVPDKIRHKWQLALHDYLKNRQSLQGIIVLMDIRRPMLAIDKPMLDWSKYNLPLHILLTKSDKLKKNIAHNVLLSVQNQLKKEYPEISVSLFSSLNKTGLEDLIIVINKWLQMEKEDLIFN